MPTPPHPTQEPLRKRLKGKTKLKAQLFDQTKLEVKEEAELAESGQVADQKVKTEPNKQEAFEF